MLGTMLLALAGCLQEASDKDFDFDNDADTTSTSTTGTGVEILLVDKTTEQVAIGNFSGDTVDLTGWTLLDDEISAPITYTFPGFALLDEGIVYVQNGSSSNTTTDLYAGVNFFEWSAGDTAILSNAEGTVIATCTQPSECFP